MIYIRVRRKKVEVFLDVDPKETVWSIKEKLHSILKVPALKQQLSFENVVLHNDRSIEDFNIVNDSEVILAIAGPDTDDFEEPDVTPFEGAPESKIEAAKEEAAASDEAGVPADATPSDPVAQDESQAK